MDFDFGPKSGGKLTQHDTTPEAGEISTHHYDANAAAGNAKAAEIDQAAEQSNEKLFNEQQAERKSSQSMEATRATSPMPAHVPAVSPPSATSGFRSWLDSVAPAPTTPTTKNTAKATHTTTHQPQARTTGPKS